MKRVCAWCKKHLSGDPDDKVISHGICKECAEKLYRENGIKEKQHGTLAG
jgi:hypothetical protein